MTSIATMMMRINPPFLSSSTQINNNTPIATASGLLALLSEPDPTLVQHALTKLLSVVNTQWHEIAEALPELEAIAEGGGIIEENTTAIDVAAAMISSNANTTVSLYDESTRRTAAALASRVFFHLEEPRQALRLALDSGDVHFNVLCPSENDGPYVEQLVNAAIGEYIQRKQKDFDGSEEEEEGNGVVGAAKKMRGKMKSEAEEEGEEEEELDMKKLHNVVQLMFQRCYIDGSYGHALGVAFEARECEKVQEILEKLSTVSSSSSTTVFGKEEDAKNLVVETLKYALLSAHDLIPSKVFRTRVLQLIANSLNEVFCDPNNSNQSSETSVTSLSVAKQNAACALVLCHQLLGDAASVGNIITQLVDDDGGGCGAKAGEDGNDDSALLGLQLCFDIIDTGDQAFVTKVASWLPKREIDASNAAIMGSNAAEGSDNVEVDDEGNATSPPANANEFGVEVVETMMMTTKIIRSDVTWTHFMNAHRILSGGFTAELSLSFLYKNSNADTLIMTNLKKALDERTMVRNSVLHNCAVTAHGYLNAGTTNDVFLRDNLDWMKKASNWAKFSATASMGVIHAGHTTEAMTLLEPYLPPSAPADDPNAAHPAVSTTGGYAEGGSLYAIGLIHGSHAGSSTSKRLEASRFIRNHLRNSHANEVISHGAALGVGLTSFGSGDLEVVNELKELLYTDSAVAGEAASIAMGMVLVGSGAGNASSSSPANAEFAEIIAELRNYSRETHHEKIIRGIAMCLALVNFGQEENADATIEEMRSDRDPIIRYGAMYGLALAYCGTGSNKAIRILLHTAVSDVSDDVRMASVIGLALVLHKTPKRVPELVRLLLESFNPHVRYASCMAVGIAMAGTGDSESVALLEPMLTDMTDHVRQGALLGTAMIYMQQSDTCNHRKIKTFRDKLASLISDKHQTTLTKMGAILSTGLIDIGGRNCALSLGSRNGFTKMTSAAGLVLWLQHWHWYPLMHMLSLAVTPTVTIGLNKNFKYPKKFEIVCHGKPSAFAHPKKLEEKKEEKKKLVETVALSTTAKNMARMARKRAKEEADPGVEGGEEAMDLDKKEEESKEAGTGVKAVAVEESENMDVDGEETNKAADASSEENKPKKKREPEPTSFRITNPSRITSAQASVCVFDLSQRYRPIRPEEKPYGVIMLTDSTPSEEENVGAVKTPAQEDEADPPEPFEWTPPGHPDHPDTAVVGEDEPVDANEEKEDASGNN